MDDIALSASTTTADHEVRIRVLEREDARTATRNSTVIAGFSNARGILLIGFAAMGALVALANFLNILAK